MFKIIVVFYLIGVLTGLLSGLISQRWAIKRNKKIKYDDALREAFLEEVNAEIEQIISAEA